MSPRVLLAGGVLWVLPLAGGDGTALAQASVVVLPTVATSRSEEFQGDFSAEFLAGALAAPDPQASPDLLLPMPPARFQVSGRRSIAFSLALPGPAGVTLQGGGTTLRVQDFRVALSFSGPGLNPGMLTLSPTGRQTLHVGASLRVPGKSPTGLFRGQIPLTLSYN